MKRLSFLLILLLVVPSVLADSGPKPQMMVKVLYDGAPVQDVYAEFLDCYTKEQLDRYQKDLESFQEPGINRINPALNFVSEDANCLWYPSQIVRNIGCDMHVCQFGYFMPEQFRLSFYLPSEDRVWVSEIIERDHFISEYNVNLRSDGELDVTNVSKFTQSDSWRSFMLLFRLFLLFGIIKVAVALVLLLVFKLKKIVSLWMLPTTAVWLFVLSLGSGAILAHIPLVFFSALVLIALDAAVLRWLSKLKWKHVTFIAIGANLAGLILGFMGFMMLSIFFY